MDSSTTPTPTGPAYRTRAETVDTSSADLSKLLHDLLRRIEPSPVPLEAWRDDVVAAYATKATSTRLKMGQAFRELIALAGPGATTADVGPGLVARFAARGGCAATVNGLLASLRAACTFGLKRGHLPPARLDGVVWRVPPDAGTGRARSHPRAAVADLLAYLRDRSESWEGGRLHVFASVLAYCGLRRNEALRLKVADVDLARGFLFVRGNGKRLKTAASGAPVPIPMALKTTLASWLTRVGSEWLIPGVRRLGPWVGGAAGLRAADRLREAGRAAGHEGMTCHSLRHSLATHLRGWWGLSREQVRMVLRHSSGWTQELYIHDDLVNLGALVAGIDFAADVDTVGPVVPAVAPAPCPAATDSESAPPAAPRVRRRRGFSRRRRPRPGALSRAA